MGNKMLRSALAAAFSAGLTFGAMGALGPAWGGGSTGVVDSYAQAAPPPDLAWDSAPAGTTDAGTDSVVPPDLAWDIAPKNESGA